MVSSTYNALGSTVFWYDGANRQIARLDANGVETRTEYYTAARQRVEIDGENQRTTLTFDGAGHEIARTNPRGYTTYLSYDGAGRNTLKADPLGRKTTCTYDAVDNLTSRTDSRPWPGAPSKAFTVAYTYDNNNRLATEIYPTGASTFRTNAYFYDPVGNRDVIHDITGTSKFEYNGLNLPTLIERPGRPAMACDYDKVGRRTGLALDTTGNFAYVYDKNGRLTSMVNPQSQTTTFTHDKVGRVKWVERADGGSTYQSYDKAGQLLQIDNYAISATPITQFLYLYDNVGNRYQETQYDSAYPYPDGRLRVFNYNRRYELVSEAGFSASGWATLTVDAWNALTVDDWNALPIDGADYRFVFSYDGAGNRLAWTDASGVTTYTYDKANQLQTATRGSDVTTYSYDGARNLILEVDPIGTTTYVWDYDSHLIQAQQFAGDVDFQYNAEGQRVKKDDGTTEQRFLYDGSRLLAEYDGAAALVRLYTASATGEYGDLISEYDTAAPETYYHQYASCHSALSLFRPTCLRR